MDIEGHTSILLTRHTIYIPFTMIEESNKWACQGVGVSLSVVARMTSHKLTEQGRET